MQILMQKVWGDSALLSSPGDASAAGPWTTLSSWGKNTGSMSPRFLAPTNIQSTIPYINLPISLVILQQSSRTKTQQRKTATELSELATLTGLQ